MTKIIISLYLNQIYGGKCMLMEWINIIDIIDVKEKEWFWITELYMEKEIHKLTTHKKLKICEDKLDH